MNNRVLVTGGTGFVGRQVLKYLDSKCVPVTAIVRNGQQSLLENYLSVKSVISTPDLFSESLDWWIKSLQGIDTVIHIAWYAEPGKYLQSKMNLDCLQGTLSMAKGSVEAGVRRFIGVGTCFEYDLTFGKLSVSTPLNPLTPYAGSKAAAFLALSQLLPAQSVEFAWCRLFYLFGEGEDPRRLVPYLRSRLAAGEIAELTSGNQIRDFINVAEAGRMISEAALSKEQGAINICSGIPITVKQLAESIASEYGREDLLKFNTRPDNLIDPPCVIGVKNYIRDE